MAVSPNVRIEILDRCDPNLERVPRETLERFQRDLKTLEREDYERLRDLMLRKGFRVPVYVWMPPEDANPKILDGHQRMFVIENEGWIFESVPVVNIVADGEKEAAEMLLAISSQFAKVTDAGLGGFIDAFDIPMGDLKEMSFPDFDFSAFEKAARLGEEAGGDGGERDEVLPTFDVIALCVDEASQRVVLDLLTEKGIECRALTS